MQQQGRETDIAGNFTDVNDYDMTLDNVTCTNCNQGVRVTFEGRFRVNNATWASDPGQIPVGTGAGLYDCDSAIRVDSVCSTTVPSLTALSPLPSTTTPPSTEPSST